MMRPEAFTNLQTVTGSPDAETSKKRLASIGQLNERQKDSVNYRLRTVEIQSIEENGLQIVSAASPFVIGDKLYFTAERPRKFSQRMGRGNAIRQLHRKSIDGFVGGRDCGYSRTRFPHPFASKAGGEFKHRPSRWVCRLS